MVFESEYVITHVPLHQKRNNIGHVLVIPKQHIRNIYELPNELGSPLMSAISLVSLAVKKAYSADGVHVQQNNEPAAGQDVFHLHFHIIPRYHEDDFAVETYNRICEKVLSASADRIRLAVSEIEKKRVTTNRSRK